MTMLSQEAKDNLIASVVNVESAVAALGDAYRALGAAYDAARTEAFSAGKAMPAPAGRNLATHYGSTIASSIGPDRFDEDIVGSMIAHGLDPLLQRTARRASSRPIENLAAEFAARVAGV